MLVESLSGNQLGGLDDNFVIVQWTAEVGDHWIAPLHVHHEEDADPDPALVDPDATLVEPDPAAPQPTRMVATAAMSASRIIPPEIIPLARGSFRNTGPAERPASDEL